ncbi:MAG: hypothetical protein G8345_09665 [Magnetococcales bacterium]|nr:hypothetical protein [Magnetococcales bacterium]NGZ27138.1 hypothetical protein [Magnetococcales bacterium]
MWSLFSFLKTRKIKCPDGTVRIVYNRIEDVFPLYIKGWQGEVNFKIKDDDGANGEISAKYKSIVDGLLFQLDELNSSIIVNFHAYYTAYSTNPCGGDGYFRDKVDGLVIKNEELKALKVQINGLIALAKTSQNSTSSFLNAYKKIITTYGLPPSPLLSASEITQSRNNMKELLNGESI